jgi:Trypsin
MSSPNNNKRPDHHYDRQDHGLPSLGRGPLGLIRRAISFGLLAGLAACHHAPTTRVFYSVGDLSHINKTLLAKHLPLDSFIPRTPHPEGFPAEFYTFSDGGFCTATLIGTDVLLTARHCVLTGSLNIDDTISPGLVGGPYIGHCNFPADENIDIALCALNDEPPGVLHETVNFNAPRLDPEHSLLLSGFGYFDPNHNTGLVPQFCPGVAQIAQFPTDESPEIVTTGDAFVDGGDSGAPAFAIKPAELLKPVETADYSLRLVVGVAETRDPTDNEDQPKSKFISTSAPQVVDFFDTWLTKNQQFKVCGRSTDAQACRGVP